MKFFKDLSPKTRYAIVAVFLTCTYTLSGIIAALLNDLTSMEGLATFFTLKSIAAFGVSVPFIISYFCEVE